MPTDEKAPSGTSRATSLRSRIAQRGMHLGRPFWLFFAGAFLFDLGLFVYFFLFNLYLIEYHITERTLGFISGAFSVGNLAGALPMGYAARRWGLKPVLLGCLLAVPALSAFRLFFFAVPVQVGLALLAGIGMSAWAVSLAPSVAALTSENNRSTAFGLVFATGIGTGAVAGLAGGLLPALLHHGHAAEGMRAVLLAACALILLGLWPMSRLRLGSLATVAAARQEGALFTPFLRRFLPALALWSFATGCFTPFANVFLFRHLHVPLARVGFVFSLSQLIQVAAVLLAPALFRAIGTVAGIACTQMCAAVALFLLGRAPDAAYAIAIYLVLTGFQWMSTPGIYALVMSRTPEPQRSRASALQTFTASAAAAGAAAASGTLIERHGYGTLLGGSACLAALAALLLYAGLGMEGGRTALAAVEAAEK